VLSNTRKQLIVTQTNNQAAYGAQLDLLSAEANSRKALASPSGTPSSDRTAKPPDVTADKTLEEASKMSATGNGSRRNSDCSAIPLNATGNGIPTPLNKGRSPNPWQEVWQTQT